MADRKVTFLIGANIQNFQKNLNKAQRTFRSFGRDMQQMGTKLTAGLTLPILGAGAVAVKTAAEYETLRQSLDILTGSAAEGARVFERLKQFSARTPFQLQDLARAQNTLMGFSLSADEAFESIQMIGDIAAVTGGDIQAIAVAFGQAAAEGKLMTRDIRQLINQGVPAVQLLADAMGVATSEVFDLAEQGEITFQVLQDAFRKATSEGGRFAGGMAKQSNTIAGLFSTLRDNVSIALGQVGEDLSRALNIKGLMSRLTEQIQRGVEWLKSLSDEAKRVGFALAGVAAAVGPTLLLLGKLAGALSALMSPALLAGAAITGLFAGVVTTGQWFVDNWAKISQGFSNAMLTMEITALKMARGVIESFKSIISFVVNKTPPGLLSSVFGIDLAGFAFDVVGVSDLLDELTRDVQRKTSELAGGIGAFNDAAWGSFSDSAGHALELTKNAIVNGLKGIVSSPKIQELLAQINSFFSAPAVAPQVQAPALGKGIGAASLPPVTAEVQLGLDPAKLRQVTGEVDTLKLALQGVKDHTELFADSAERMDAAVTQAFMNIAATGVSSLGELARVTVNTARQIIAAEIAQGIASAVKSALTDVPFPFNIAAAAGAGAAAAGLFSAIVPKLASGGVIPSGFPGDSYPAMLSSGETVIPPPKALPAGMGTLKVDGELRAKGTDLVLILERAKKSYR